MSLHPSPVPNVTLVPSHLNNDGKNNDGKGRGQTSTESVRTELCGVMGYKRLNKILPLYSHKSSHPTFHPHSKRCEELLAGSHDHNPRDGSYLSNRLSSYLVNLERADVFASHDTTELSFLSASRGPCPAMILPISPPVCLSNLFRGITGLLENKDWFTSIFMHETPVNRLSFLLWTY